MMPAAIVACASHTATSTPTAAEIAVMLLLGTVLTGMLVSLAWRRA